MDSSEPNSPSSHPIRWLMLAGVWLIYFCFGLTVTSLAPLVRPVTQDLGMSYAEMGSVLGAWQLVYIVTALPCGALVDRFGLRRSLLLCSLVMGFSFILRAYAVDHISVFQEKFDVGDRVTHPEETLCLRKRHSDKAFIKLKDADFYNSCHWISQVSERRAKRC